MKITNKKIAFSALFFSYWQLKITHKDPQIERYMDSSLPRTSRRETDYDISRRKPSCAMFCKKNRRLNIKPAHSLKYITKAPQNGIFK